MKKAISILLSIVMLMCVFTFVMPSFALSDSDFTYEIVDEKIVITGYNGNSAAITVPAEINGIPVVKISDGAFKGNASLTSVTVSAGVKDIGASAFENCTKLATISLPETIIHIGEKAIYNTAYYNNTSNWRLKKTQNDGTASGNVGIGGGTGSGTIDWEDISAPVLQYLYLGKNLIEIELEGIYSVKYGTLVIADGAFKGNDGAIDVGLPDSIVTIGCDAFEGCTSLESVRNLNLVDYIGDGAFKDCTSLEKLDISETALFNANAIYNTGYFNNAENWKNGVLYMGNRVVDTDNSTSETFVCDGVTHIGGEALANKDAVIPESVIYIADNAFTSVENVTLFGYSGTYAETYANQKNISFVDLGSLTKGDVDFNGTVDENDLNILYGVSALQKYEGYAISLAGDMNEDGAVDGLDAIILDLFLKEMGPSTLKGDANGDGKVNEADYELLVKISSSNEKIKDNFMFDRCDLNEDGAVDGFDAMYLDLALNRLVALV